MSKFIIGVDGGGTKTLSVLWDKDGNEIKRYQTGFANFSVDKDKTKKNLINAIDNLIDLKESNKIIIGVAGNLPKKELDLFVKELSKKYSSDVEIVTDGYLALKSIPTNLDSVSMIVVGGTGSVVYAINGVEVVSIGGYGHIIGDEGSAYHLVLESIRVLIKDYEENDKLSSFSINLMKGLNIDDVNSVKEIIYKESKDFAASKATIISDLATNNDKKAIELLSMEGSYLAKQVVDGYKKISANNITIALRGGFLLNAPYVKTSFINYLDNSGINYVIDSKYYEPVTGAFNISLEEK